MKPTFRHATLLDRPVDLNRLVKRPGLYAADSTSPAFGQLLGLVDTKAAKLVGERFLPAGQKVVVVQVGDRAGVRGNPSISIGAEFFVTALKDYSDWRQKWWREAVQNSVDGGARHVTCDAVLQADGTMVVSIQDDGRGMDQDTLLNKFLVLGGTTKVLGSGAAGGFGKAKELLVLPWLGWKVHTRDKIAQGSGIQYEVTDAPFLQGTRLEVHMPADNYTYAAPCLAFLGKCDLPGIQFTVNGTPAQASLRGLYATQHLVETIGDLAEVHFIPLESEKRYQMYIRAKGLFMFESYVSDTPGQLVVELLAPSIEILTANRDGFRDPQVRRALDRLAEKIAKDSMSALRNKRGMVRKKYQGTGRFKAERREADALASIGPIPYANQKGEVQLPDASAATLAGLVDEYREQAARDESKPEVASLPNRVLAHELLDGIQFMGANHVEAAIKQLVWEPDFFLINEIDGFKVPKKFFPESMTPRVLKLAKSWVEACRYVLMQLGSERRYGVGFMFSGDTAAAHIEDEDGHWLMLNPLVRMGRDEEIWSPSNDYHLRWIYAAAVHEATHMADGITYHDEAFASALTTNMAKTADGFRRIKRIVGAIKMRGGLAVD